MSTTHPPDQAPANPDKPSFLLLLAEVEDPRIDRAKNHALPDILFLAPRTFQECPIRWTEGIRERIPGETVAIDGKAQSRARNKNENLQYIVNACRWGGGPSPKPLGVTGE